MQQYRHYQSIREIMRLKPSQQPDKFGEMVMFLAQVSQCFPKVLAAFSDDVMGLLTEYAEVLDPELRQTLCRALFLMRNKGLVSSSTVLALCFKLFRCPDKQLRTMLYKSIVSDIQQLNRKHKNNAVNRSLQNFMYSMLNDTNAVAAKKSLDVMIEL